MKTSENAFQQVRSHRHFDIEMLAWEADVQAIVIYRMLLNEPVARSDAQRVLDALARESGERYTVETLAIRLDNFPMLP
jgi:hypothetical protein